MSADAAVAPNPDLVGLIPDVGQAKDVAIVPSVGLAYVASTQFGLAVVDVSNPGSPVVIGCANPAFTGSGVAVGGGLAVVSAGGSGIRVVDVSNPFGPVTMGALSGTFGSPSFPRAQRLETKAVPYPV